MKSLLFVLGLTCTLTVLHAQSAERNKWEVVLSGVSFEQHDGLIFSGAVQHQFANAIIVSAPIKSEKNYLRFQARRIDWSTDISNYEGREISDTKGFAAGLGFERRWFASDRFWIHAGGDIFYQRTHVTGTFEADPDLMLSTIDHTKQNVSLSPLLGLNFQISKWLYARIETGANLGVTTIQSHTETLLTSSDVYSDASLKPVSVLGLAVRI